MLLFCLRTLLYAIAVNAPFFNVCNATQLPININVNTEDRQFLIDKNLIVAIAFASPLSENNTSVIVPLVLEPSAD